MSERLKKLNIILDASGLSGASFSALITAFTILLNTGIVKTIEEVDKTPTKNGQIKFCLKNKFFESFFFPLFSAFFSGPPDKLAEALLFS